MGYITHSSHQKGILCLERDLQKMLIYLRKPRLHNFSRGLFREFLQRVMRKLSMKSKLPKNSGNVFVVIRLDSWHGRMQYQVTTLGDAGMAIAGHMVLLQL